MPWNIICHEIFPVAAWFCKWVSTCSAFCLAHIRLWNFLLAAELQLHRGCETPPVNFSLIENRSWSSTCPQSTYVIPSVFLKITSTDNLQTLQGEMLSIQWMPSNIFDRGSIKILSGEGNGNPLQCSCLENPRDGGAWWAAVSGVPQNQTWLSSFTFTFLHVPSFFFSFTGISPINLVHVRKNRKFTLILAKSYHMGIGNHILKAKFEVDQQ